METGMRRWREDLRAQYGRASNQHQETLSMSAIAERSLAEIADTHEAAEAAHDSAGVAKTFAAEGVLDPKPTGATFTGHTAITAWYADLFTAFPDLAPALVNRYQDGNVIVDEVVFSGRHDGPFLGIPATGKLVKVAASVVYEFAGGAIIRESAYWDVATMLIQMGVLPAPGG
jgi:steroid delta-isomerase-like uncharacterized protein